MKWFTSLGHLGFPRLLMHTLEVASAQTPRIKAFGAPSFEAGIQFFVLMDENVVCQSCISLQMQRRR